MKEKRTFFRIDVYNIPIQIVTSFGKKEEGVIKDLSRIGVSLYCDVDLGVGNVEVTYTLLEESFTMPMEYIRRTDVSRGRYLYAYGMLEKGTREQERLFQVLTKMDAIRRRNRLEEE